MEIPLFQGIFTPHDPPILWHILGAYFLLIWGVGVARIIFNVSWSCNTILTEAIQAKIKDRGFRNSSPFAYASESETQSLGFSTFSYLWVVGAKPVHYESKSKENLGEFICMSTTKAKAGINPLIFTCNRLHADGIMVEHQK